jgi:uncharacterized protein (TIGR02996 family)
MGIDHHHPLEQALLEDPDDQGTLLVYADWLLSRGDPRGDLITLHHALDGQRDPNRVKALREAEKQLLSRHSARLVPPELRGQVEHRATWQNGFIRTLFLQLRGNLSDADLLRQVLSHPSLRCLTELQLGFWSTGHEPVLAALSQLAPPALRTLQLGRDGYGAVAGASLTALEALPRLERLVLHEGFSWDRPAHRRLKRLELAAGSTILWDGLRRGRQSEPALQTLAELDGARLPALRALRVTGLNALGSLSRALGSPEFPALSELELDRCADLDGLCAALAASPLLAKLATLQLSDSMTPEGARLLAAAGDGLSLERLDVSGNRLDNSARSLLEPLSRELVFGWQQGEGGRGEDLADDAWYVRHTRRPDWGVGRVVENRGDKLEIVFENAGRKTIASTLPCLESISEDRIAGDSPLRQREVVHPKMPAPSTPEERAVSRLAGALVIKILEGRVRDHVSALARQAVIDDEERRDALRTLRLSCLDLATLAGASKGRLRQVTLREARRSQRTIDPGLIDSDLRRRLAGRRSSLPDTLEVLLDEDDAHHALDRFAPCLPLDANPSADESDRLLDLLLDRR